MKFKEIKKNEAASMTCLVTGFKEGITRGNPPKPFTDTVVSDGETTVQLKIWDTAGKEMEPFVGKVIRVFVNAGEYNGQVSYSAKGFEGTDEDPLGYIVKAPLDIDAGYQYLLKKVRESRPADVKGISYSDVALALLQEWKERILYWSAAKKMHHAYYGGWLYHTLCVTLHGESDARIYKGVNKELLVCGSALHDIGKLRELDTNQLGGAEYTPEGNLKGHIVVGYEMVMEKARLLGLDSEKTSLIGNMILSHHGKKEFGSPVFPATLEAYLLSENDMKDSRADMYISRLKEMEKGECAEGGLPGGVYLYKEKESRL